MRKFFIAVCFLATICDAVAVMLGLCVAAKVKTVPAYVFSGVGALVIIALVVSSRDVWRRHDIVHRAMRGFWCLALMVNVATVFLATGNHVILEKPISDSVSFDFGQVYMAGLLQLITISVLTLFLTAAPVGISFLWRTFYQEDDDEEEAEVPAKERKPNATRAAL